MSWPWVALFAFGCAMGGALIGVVIMAALVAASRDDETVGRDAWQ